MKYSSIHSWLRRKFGAANKCEMCHRAGRSKYEWSNKDHKYKRRRGDYQMLCTQCHRNYDFQNGLIKSRGDNHVCAKITQKEAEEIRRKYIPVIYPFSKLADEYKISKSSIIDIIKGRTWKVYKI